MQVLIMVSFICFAGALMPFLLSLLWLTVERQLEKRRDLKRQEVIALIQEMLLGTVCGITGTNIALGLSDLKNIDCINCLIKSDKIKKDNNGMLGESTVTALKSLVAYQLKPRHLRFIKSEYGEIDKWIEKRIRIFLYDNLIFSY